MDPLGWPPRGSTSSCTMACRPRGLLSTSTSTSTSPSSPAQEKICLGSMVGVGSGELIRSKRASVWGRQLELTQEKGPKFESIQKINSGCTLQTITARNHVNGCSATYLFRYSKVYYVYCRNNKVYSFNPRARKPSKSNTFFGVRVKYFLNTH